MSYRWILIALLLGGCASDDEPGVVESQDVSMSDTQDVSMTDEVVADTGTGIVVLDAAPEPIDIAQYAELKAHVTVPRCVPQAPCPFRVHHEDPWSHGAVSVSLNGATMPDLTLYRGQGSGVLPGVEAGEHDLVLLYEDEALSKTVEVLDIERATHSGLVPEQNWAADVIHHVTDALSIDGALRIAPGTAVVIAPGANIEVSGAITAQGTEEYPIVFTSESEAPWGGVRLIGHETSELSHVFLTHGGGDTSKFFGHSDSQPLIRIKAGRLNMNSGAIVDSPGKAFGCTTARLELEDVLVARVDTGGELDRCALELHNGHISEIPDGDGLAEDDDNDGIYLLGVYLDGNEMPVRSLISDSFFFMGEDDGIDHNDAFVRVERTWIEGFAHEGIAASVGNSISVVDSVIRGCDQGVEAGYGSPTVEVDHCLITDNNTGIRFGDSYDWETDGSLTVSHTVSVNNETNVRNFLNSTGAPHPSGLNIACSMVDDADWDEVANNASGVPVITQGCVEADLMAQPCDGKVPGPKACE
jgi:hypothetical protein